jgi:hypothetical protein
MRQTTYSCGVIVHDRHPARNNCTRSLGLIIAVALGLSLVALGWARMRATLLVPLCLPNRLEWTIVHTAVISPNDLRRLIADEQLSQLFRGRICETLLIAFLAKTKRNRGGPYASLM